MSSILVNIFEECFSDEKEKHVRNRSKVETASSAYFLSRNHPKIQFLNGPGRQWLPVSGGIIDSKACFVREGDHLHVVPNHLCLVFQERKKSFELTTKVQPPYDEMFYTITLINPDGSLGKSECGLGITKVWQAIMKEMIPGYQTRPGNVLKAEKVQFALQQVVQATTIPENFPFLKELNQWLAQSFDTAAAAAAATTTGAEASATTTPVSNVLDVAMPPMPDFKKQRQGTDGPLRVPASTFNAVDWEKELGSKLFDFENTHQELKNDPEFRSLLSRIKNCFDGVRAFMIRMNYGMLLFAEQQTDLAFEQFIRCKHIEEQISCRDNSTGVLRYYALRWEGLCHQRLGRYDFANSCLESVLRYFHTLSNVEVNCTNLSECANSYAHLGWLHFETQSMMAVDYFQKAISIRLQYTNNAKALMEDYYGLGSAHLRFNNLKYATEAFEHARSLAEFNGRPESKVYRELGICRVRLGQYAQARSTLCIAIDLVTLEKGRFSAQSATLKFLLACAIRVSNLNLLGPNREEDNDVIVLETEASTYLDMCHVPQNHVWRQVPLDLRPCWKDEASRPKLVSKSSNMSSFAYSTSSNASSSSSITSKRQEEDLVIATALATLSKDATQNPGERIQEEEEEDDGNDNDDDDDDDDEDDEEEVVVGSSSPV